MSRKAKEQWANPDSRKKILDSIVAEGISRRIRYCDISEPSNWEAKLEDGRLYTYYWDDNERKRSIYRYQWVWRQAHGPIPHGCVIHHKNFNCTDDRIENLELMDHLEHAKYHGSLKTSAPLPEWICQLCGVRFKMKSRNGLPRQYCSFSCKQKAYGLARRGKFKPGSRRDKAAKKKLLLRSAHQEVQLLLIPTTAKGN